MYQLWIIMIQDSIRTPCPPSLTHITGDPSHLPGGMVNPGGSWIVVCCCCWGRTASGGCGAFGRVDPATSPGLCCCCRAAPTVTPDGRTTVIAGWATPLTTGFSTVELPWMWLMADCVVGEDVVVRTMGEVDTRILGWIIGPLWFRTREADEDGPGAPRVTCWPPLGSTPFWALLVTGLGCFCGVTGTEKLEVAELMTEPEPAVEVTNFTGPPFKLCRAGDSILETSTADDPGAVLGPRTAARWKLAAPTGTGPGAAPTVGSPEPMEMEVEDRLGVEPGSVPPDSFLGAAVGCPCCGCTGSHTFPEKWSEETGAKSRFPAEVFLSPSWDSRDPTRSLTASSSTSVKSMSSSESTAPAIFDLRPLFNWLLECAHAPRSWLRFQHRS